MEVDILSYHYKPPFYAFKKPFLDIVFSDATTGAAMSVTMFGRNTLGPNEYLLGNIAIGTHECGVGGISKMGIIAKNEDPDSDFLKEANSWNLCWNCNGCNAKGSRSYWIPTPPPGYVALGGLGVNKQSNNDSLPKNHA